MGNSGVRAVLDGIVAVVGSLGLGASLLVLNDAPPAVNLAAIVTGLTLVTAVAVSVVRRRPSFSGPADRVTLLRSVLAGGCATLVVLSLSGAVPTRSWWLILLAVPALILDAVDGAVARRTATASRAGARLDMETDAALLLILSVPAAVTVGYWALLIGMMRYLFVAASWVRPALKGTLPFSRFRKVVAAVQGIVLIGVVLPFIPVPLAAAAAAAALILLAISFGRDIHALESSRAATARRRYP